MLERVLSLAVITGFVGALPAPAWPSLPAEGLPCALLGAAWQLLVAGAVSAAALPYRTPWPTTALAAALVGTVGQGLACIYVGAAPTLLLPAALTTTGGAALYRLLTAVEAKPQP